MRWLNLFKKADNPSLASIFGVTPTASGLTIGPQTALSVPAVNAAIRVIAESVAALPLHLFRRDGDVKAKDTAQSLYRLVHDEPNAWTSSYDLRLQMQTDVMLHGNAFAFVNRVGGIVREIIRLVPTSVSVTAGASGEPLYAVADTTGQTRHYDFSEILHVKAVSTDGLTGIAPIRLAREAIALALALEAHAARLLGNGARPSGILKFKGVKLNKDHLDRIKASWTAAHTGQSSGGTAVFDTDTEFQPLTFSSVDLQYLELRRFQTEEISRAFRVPPHLLSELGRATWGNAAEMGQTFLDYSLLPWLIQWQSALTRTLLKPDERQNSFIEFDTAALTRANLTARTEAYSKAVGGPWMAPNEARALENRPPIEGGSELLKPANDNQPAPKDIAA
jgi:HK97 family phage portal protein